MSRGLPTISAIRWTEPRLALSPRRSFSLVFSEPYGTTDLPCRTPSWSFIFRTLLWSSPSGLPRAHFPARSRNGFTPRTSFSSLRLYQLGILLQSQPFLKDELLRSSECTWCSPTFTQAFLPCPLDSRRMWPPFWSSPSRSIHSPTAFLLGLSKIPGPGGTYSRGTPDPLLSLEQRVQCLRRLQAQRDRDQKRAQRLDPPI